MKKYSTLLKDSMTALAAGLLIGAVVGLFSLDNFLMGWWQAGLYSALLVFGLIRVWRLAGSGRTLAILMIVTFGLRLVLGIFLYQGLPAFGFDTPVQQAGYVFSDAYERDQAAYQISVSGQNWLPQFVEQRAVDQYGGLLALSTLIYRLFSSDAHRPLLLVMLSASAMSAGAGFLFAAVQRKWGEKVARATLWVFALYPEGVLLGSSQMREPLLIGLAALLFWLSLNWKEKPFRTLVAMGLTTLAACLISIPGGAVTLLVVGGLVYLEWFSFQQNRTLRRVSIIFFISALGLATAGGWYWLKEGLYYEFYTTTLGSGMIQVLFEGLPQSLRNIAITLYGFSQPLLPAALVDPSKAIWQGIAIFRAAGWYFVLPFLVYTFFRVFYAQEKDHKSLLVFLSLIFAVWVVVSSLRAGGDQWDNPRYRATLLPWMSILVGWTWAQLSSNRNLWFWFIVSMESLFVLLLTGFYLNRFVNLKAVQSLKLTMMLFGGIALLIVIVFLILNKKSRQKPALTKKP
mgnify:CR=1 FL=1